MDAIDAQLESAWRRLIEHLRDKPAELPRRLARREQSLLQRPLRAWCLCLRASDTRIRHEVTAFFSRPLAEAHQPHDIHFTGPMLRPLVKPITLPKDGIRWTRAARLLGMHEETLRNWIKRGVFHHVEYDYCRANGYCGKPCPYLFCQTPLDPNATLGQPPDPLWRTVWQYHHQRIPDHFEFTTERLPRYVLYRGQPRFRGWNFLCPSCQRQTQRLFCPVSVWTLDQFLPIAAFWPHQPDAMPGRPHPLESANLAAPHHGQRTFACQHCWKVRYTNFSSARESWNQFVTHISNGLLFGREVPMPPDYRQADRRKRAYRPCLNRAPSQRRAQVEDLLMQGLTYQQIADQLNVSYGTVHNHIKELYKQHTVHSRAQLAMKLGRTRPTTIPHPDPKGAKA